MVRIHSNSNHSLFINLSKFGAQIHLYGDNNMELICAALFLVYSISGLAKKDPSS